MKVFISGATGHIGFAVASAFSRAGHQVYGLTRSKDRSALLERNEIIPVVGDMQDISAYEKVLSPCQILIHCAADYSGETLLIDHNVVRELISSAQQRGLQRTIIYTSGSWVYGDTAEGVVDESSALNPPQFVQRRVEVERMVLAANASNLCTLVIRPACVYGGGGSLTALWFETAMRAGAASFVGQGNNRWGMVHRDDLAQLYLRAAESGLGGEVFNATDRSRFTVEECARAASWATGAGGKIKGIGLEEAREKFGVLTDGLLLNQHVDSSKAVRMLGWQPRHGGFADGAEAYFRSWKAAAP